MIKNPKHGWCDFTVGGFTGHPSYLTDVPVDLLEAFITYFRKGCSAVCLDEEGNGTFTLVLSPDTVYVIESRNGDVLHAFPETSAVALALELVSDIRRHIDGWMWWNADGSGEASEYRAGLLTLVDALEGMLTERGWM